MAPRDRRRHGLRTHPGPLLHLAVVIALIVVTKGWEWVRPFMASFAMSPSVDLPFSLKAAGVARRVVANSMANVGASDDAMFNAQLVTSEVVTNAVTHGGEPAHLKVSNRAGTLHVEVSDSAPEPFDVPRSNGGGVDPQIGGFGLKIVDTITSAWGVEFGRPPDGKTVWFDIRLDNRH